MTHARTHAVRSLGILSGRDVVKAAGLPARVGSSRAVRVLVAEGLVYVVQGRGAYVARHS
jgi:hypothetical protein